ncbi:beta-galactosidase-1-like protein 2 [Ctenodactylus gundi]
MGSLGDELQGEVQEMRELFSFLSLDLALEYWDLGGAKSQEPIFPVQQATFLLPTLSMGTYLVAVESFLCLSSALSVMAQPSRVGLPRIDQTQLSPSSMKNRKIGLRVEGSNFTLDGSPFLIIAGTMHYFRVPQKYWRDRLLKMKACGFNTLTTHIPWNLHEPLKGIFHFIGNLDLMAFISMASDVGLWVIVCPGPYIGSDLDLGGLPSWLLRDPKMKLRTTYRGFTKAVKLYFNELIPKIESLQYHRGGPIIAVQIENEYGSYWLDRKYMTFVKKNILERTTLKRQWISPKLVQNDGSTRGMASPGERWENGSEELRVFVMKNVREMFNLRFSLNFYMFHGGTNFGFMGGAESLDTYLPAVTSYDYGALLTESGDYTPEYLSFQEFFRSVTEVSTTFIPELRPKTAYETLTRLYFMTLWEMLPYLDRPTKSIKPISMEQLSVNHGSGQSYGYALYETIIKNGGFLISLDHVRDRAQVFLNDKYIGVLDHTNDQLYIKKNSFQGSRTLRILVENQGRLAYGPDISKERKGLIGDIYLDNSPLRKFTIYSLEMKIYIQRKLPTLWKSVKGKVWGPAFFVTFLRIGGFPQDTFMKLKGWNKGVIFVNGRNIGRYWNKGPQQTIYVPGPWLNSGTNEIVVFEELESGVEIQFTEQQHLVLAGVRSYSYTLDRRMVLL